MRVSVFAMLLSAGAASAEPPSGQPKSASDMAAVREADRLRTIDLNHAARARSDRAAARAAQAADARHDAYDRQRRAYEAALEDNRRARERASDAAGDYAAARADYARELAEWRARAAPPRE